MSKKKQTATLDDWALNQYGDCYCLSGFVSDHPNFEDEAFIRTSRLVRIDFENGKAETLNTIYKLK